MVSPMFLSWLTDTFLPARSLADLIGLSCFTSTALKSLPCSPVEETPLATTLIGRPCSLAVSSEVTLPKANWNWPPTAPEMLAAPPCTGVMDRSIFCLSKKPLALPRWIGAVSTMAITPAVTLSFPPAPCGVPAEPHAAAGTRRAATRQIRAERRISTPRGVSKQRSVRYANESS